MEKIELLSPVGNKESLYMAVHAGADAVYLSGKRFGARAFAANFDDEEIKEAINYCHIYGVKVYVTMNTLIFEDEINDFIEYAKFLYLNNVDAVIVQDIGMISYLRKILPDLEIHSSTQTHNYNIETTKMFKEMGVKRAVLARELTIEEIKEHSKIMDTEVFVHGALCMSYSGCCYMSLLRGSRSGNRGMCAGTCRLKYETKNGKKYLLSTKDLCNIYDLDKIIESNTKSLKIEGRMKSKEYVYLVTKLYRNTIDKYYETKKIEVDEKIYNDIKKVFNRDYTSGHKFKALDIMNQERPNHKGILLGTVIKTDKKYITIKLSSDIVKGDGIKFESTDTGLIVNELFINNKKVDSAKSNQIITIKNTIDLNVKSTVVKTLDKKLIDELKTIEEKKIKINCKVVVDNDYIVVEYDDGINKVEKTCYEVEKPIKLETTKEEIKERLSKLGSTPFVMDKISIDIKDKKFINIKVLNDIRRSLVDELIDKRTNYNRTIKLVKEEEYNMCISDTKKEISVSIINEEQYKIVKEMNVDNIYTNNYELHKKYSDTFFIMPRINKYDVYDTDKIVINDYNYLSKNMIANYYLNITNSKSCIFLHEKGINKICVSPDLNIDHIKQIKEKLPYINFEVQVYGSKEVMITANNFGNVDYFRDKSYEYFVINNKNYISILNKPENNINKIKEYKNIGIKSFRIDFINENTQEIKKILQETKKAL